jgi:formylglycine-generating enzyme required for sulfatase activity
MFPLLACAASDELVVRRAHPDLSEDTAPAEVSGSAPCPSDMAPVGGACMDRYEAPNVAGALPLVMYTLVEAAAWCEAREKRLCTDEEWQAACEGGVGLAYPYGDEHEPGRCNDEETWRVYDQDELNAWPSSASGPEVESLDALLAAAGRAGEEVASLYQGEGSGENTGCVNDFGVYDLVGNVEEWAERADGGEVDFHGALKGRYWAESRTCQSAVTTHGDGFRFYEIGFRCCAEVSSG